MWETSRLSSLLVPRAWTCLSNATESLLVVEMKFTIPWRASLECHQREVSLDITKLSAQKGCYACAGSALPPWAAFAATHVLYIPLLMYMRWVEQPEPRRAGLGALTGQWRHQRAVGRRPSGQIAGSALTNDKTPSRT